MRPSPAHVTYIGTRLSPAKTAEQIAMSFRKQTRVGPKNRVLDGVQILPQWERVILRRFRWDQIRTSADVDAITKVVLRRRCGLFIEPVG